MSYEGFEEYLCEDGHYTTQDAMAWMHGCGGSEICSVCQKRIAWSHAVDETNGYDEDHPGTCCAPKIPNGFTDEWHVDHYGNRFATKRQQYRPSAGSDWRSSKTGKPYAVQE